MLRQIKLSLSPLAGLIFIGSVTAGIPLVRAEDSVVKRFKLEAITDTVPDFTIKNAQGKAVRFSSLTNKPMILHFWASWCVPCQQELPELARLAARLDPVTIQFVPISIDRSAEAAQAQAITAGLRPEIPFWIIADEPDRSPGHALWAWGVPLTYFVSNGRRLIARAVGSRKWSEMTAADLRTLFASGAPVSDLKTSK